MVLKNHISHQYITKRQINCTILDTINPGHYVLKECPSYDASLEATEFAEAEDSMQKYYESVESCFFQMPVKDSIVVVLHDNKFYRARVINILALSAGHLFKVYLLDYGKECSVRRDRLYEIKRDFLAHPFQAVNFKLLGIEPVSLVMSSMDLSVSYGPVPEWDMAATRYISSLQKVMCSAYIEIKAIDEKSVFGNLFMTFGDASIKCINDELVQKKYAHFNEDCWNSVQNIDSVIEGFNTRKEKSPVSRPDHHSPISSGIVPKFADLNVKFIDSDGNVVGESSLMKKAEPLSNTQEDIQQTVTEEIVKHSVASVPVTAQTDKVHSSSSKKMLMLQKLLRQKQSLSSQSDTKCDNLQKSPSEISNPNVKDALSKETRENPRNLSHDGLGANKTKSVTSSDIEYDKMNLSCDPSNEPKKSNITVPESSPKQCSTSGALETPSGNLKKFQMLQKLKVSKRSPVQQLPNKTESSKKEEESEIKSQSCAKSPSNSDTL